MKLLIVTGLFYPSKLGGPANTLYWLSKALVNVGIEVSVIATYRHIDAESVQSDKWNTVDGVRALYCSANGKLPLNQIKCAEREMKSSDIVMLSSICYLPNSLVAVCARFQKKKIIWSPRGELMESALHGDKAKLLFFKLLQIIKGHVTFHATSEEEKMSIQHIFGPKIPIIVLPNYMEVPAILRRGEIQAPYLVYVGRIAPLKAIDNILEGLAKSKKFMQSNYVFKIVGGVEPQFQDFYEKLQTMRDELRLFDKVVFVGSKSGEDKFQLYADAKFSMLVSKSENFGNVVIEALSQGTPVIASHGTPWQVLEDRKAGFWIDNSSDSIAECVDKVLTMNDEDYGKMRSNALKLVEEYDINKNVAKWKTVLEDLRS